jgi:hypothetical protein
MNWLKNTFPILWSPQFWGVVGLATFTLAKAKGWLDADLSIWFQTVFGLGTGIGTAAKMIKKAKADSQV